MTNPEFRKNLWLEMTPYRLVGMPLVILSILYLAYLTGGSRLAHDVASAAITFYFLITVVWGTKQASETIVNEIREHTWDGQRMSSLTPWQLVWGKLFGSTAYTWYGSAMLLAAYWMAGPDPDPVASLETVVVLVLTGIFAHAVTMLGSLLSIQKERKFVRSQSTGILLLGIMTASILLASYFGKGGGTLTWFGAGWQLRDFMLVSVTAITLWALLGVYQLMRRELQMVNSPAAWLAFLIFLMVYCGGLVAGQKVPANDPFQGVNRPVLVAFYLAVAASYLMAFIERKDLLTLQRVVRLAEGREWLKLLQRAPRWLLTFPLGLLMALGVAATAGAGFKGGPDVAAFVAAVIFFQARDLGILLFCNLAHANKRADLLAVLYLFLLYGIIPGILQAMHQGELTVLFWPRPDRSPFLLIVPLLEMLAVFYLLSARWKKRVSEVGR
ncbi:hypothetical protein [Geomonas sp.]|uniref:hypothetical protein n=1 Tax=Geomonas sp. TaxID=2651584 RepID=UPI002B4657C7|nr:hypothetical protein [Geomonas sp.]HJV36789.1 hypothetical protein [Geomonas sp.]